MALDANGNLHVAGSLDGDLVHLTNAAGAWSLQPIARPDGLERVDKIEATAVDGSGRIAVAYARDDCPPQGCLEYGGEIRVALIEPGETEVRAVELGDGTSPSVALSAGVVHVVWLAGRFSDDNYGCPRPAMYATNASGDWVTTKLIADAASGLALAIGPDGEPVVATTNPCYSLPDPGYLIALGPDGSPQREAIPAIEDGDTIEAIAVDATGQTHLLFWDFDDQIRYAFGGPNGWSERVRVLEGLYARGLATDDSGVAHFVAMGNGGLAYASSSAGSTLPEMVTNQNVATIPTIVLDSTGMPHILFATADNDGDPAELWYATAIH